MGWSIGVCFFRIVRSQEVVRGREPHHDAVLRGPPVWLPLAEGLVVEGVAEVEVPEEGAF